MPGRGTRRDAAAPGGAVASLRPSLLSAALIGVGVMAAVDEVVFHQLLAWHHFYDRATPQVGLLSDGLLHAAELVAVVGGFFWLSDLRRRALLVAPAAWGGFLMGAGGFQLFDGLVDHKVLRVHQIRYGVGLGPYDLVWNLAAVLLLACGAALALRARRRRAGDTRTPPGDRRP